MTDILLIVQIVLVVLLTIAVLLQKSSSIGLGAYSGSNETVFGAKGPGSFLAKTTFFLGFLFVANTITLGYMYSQQSNESVVTKMLDESNVAAPSASTTQTSSPIAPATPQAPAAVEHAPAAPTAPAVPKSTQPNTEK